MTSIPQASKTTLRVLLVAALVLFVAGVASAATYDSDDEAGENLAAGEDGATTTTVAGGDAGDSGTPAPSATGEVPDTAAGDEGGGETATTAAPTESTAPPQTTIPDSQPPGGAQESAPTTAGSYVYDVTGTATVNGEKENVDRQATLTVSSVDANGRQTQVTDSRDEGGEGSVTTTTYRYAPEGVYLESLKLETTVTTPLGKVNDTRNLVATSPFLLIPADAGPGTKTSGRLAGDGITADIDFTVESIDADRSTAKLVADLSGDAEGRQTSTIVARTSDRLPLQTDDTSDVTAMGFRVQSDTTSVLRQ